MTQVSVSSSTNIALGQKKGAYLQYLGQRYPNKYKALEILVRDLTGKKDPGQEPIRHEFVEGPSGRKKRDYVQDFFFNSPEGIGMSLDDAVSMVGIAAEFLGMSTSQRYGYKGALWHKKYTAPAVKAVKVLAPIAAKGYMAYTRPGIENVPERAELTETVLGFGQGLKKDVRERGVGSLIDPLELAFPVAARTHKILRRTGLDPEEDLLRSFDPGGTEQLNRQIEARERRGRELFEEAKKSDVPVGEVSREHVRSGYSEEIQEATRIEKRIEEINAEGHRLTDEREALARAILKGEPFGNAEKINADPRIKKLDDRIDDLNQEFDEIMDDPPSTIGMGLMFLKRELADTEGKISDAEDLLSKPFDDPLSQGVENYPTGFDAAGTNDALIAEVSDLKEYKEKLQTQITQLPEQQKEYRERIAELDGMDEWTLAILDRAISQGYIIPAFHGSKGDIRLFDEGMRSKGTGGGDTRDAFFFAARSEDVVPYMKKWEPGPGGLGVSPAAAGRTDISRYQDKLGIEHGGMARRMGEIRDEQLERFNYEHKVELLSSANKDLIDLIYRKEELLQKHVSFNVTIPKEVLDALDAEDALGFDTSREAARAILSDPDWETAWEVESYSNRKVLKEWVAEWKELRKVKNFGDGLNLLRMAFTSTNLKKEGSWLNKDRVVDVTGDALEKELDNLVALKDLYDFPVDEIIPEELLTTLPGDWKDTGIFDQDVIEEILKGSGYSTIQDFSYESAGVSNNLKKVLDDWAMLSPEEKVNFSDNLASKLELAGQIHSAERLTQLAFEPGYDPSKIASDSILDKKLIEEYRELKRDGDVIGEARRTMDIWGGASIYQVRLKIENPYILEMNGKAYNGSKYREAIDKAKSGGHDGVIVKNVADGADVTDVYMVFKAEQIRSKNAMFDPLDAPPLQADMQVHVKQLEELDVKAQKHFRLIENKKDIIARAKYEGAGTLRDIGDDSYDRLLSELHELQLVSRDIQAAKWEKEQLVRGRDPDVVAEMRPEVNALWKEWYAMTSDVAVLEEITDFVSARPGTYGWGTTFTYGDGYGKGLYNDMIDAGKLKGPGAKESFERLKSYPFGSRVSPQQGLELTGAAVQNHKKFLSSIVIANNDKLADLANSSVGMPRKDILASVPLAVPIGIGASSLAFLANNAEAEEETMVDMLPEEDFTADIGNLLDNFDIPGLDSPEAKENFVLRNKNWAQRISEKDKKRTEDLQMIHLWRKSQLGGNDL
jgi:predicted  nucleic acid-binding Zn-ribbon protein